MTGWGHRWIGAISGLAVFSYLTEIKQIGAVVALIASYAFYKGNTAPDFLEITNPNPFSRKRSPVFKHRTLTHCLSLWLLLFGLSLYLYTYIHTYFIFSVCFCLGALLHLLFDIPNPQGIPLFLPYEKRFSLNLWQSGKMEIPSIFMVSVIAISFCSWIYLK